jgi:hypothetical protein
MKSLPIGTVIIWDNPATIPSGWQIASESVGKFICGANDEDDLLDTGGAESHIHTQSDTGERGAHNHGGSMSCGGTGSVGTSVVYAGGTSGVGAHTHSGGSISISSAGAHSHTIGDTQSADNDPYHLEILFIERVS